MMSDRTEYGYILAILYVVLGAVWLFSRKPTFGSLWTRLIELSLAAVLLAIWLSIWPDPLGGHRVMSFLVMRLLSYAVFLHLPLFFAGVAVIARKTARKTALIAAIASISLWAIATDAFLIEPRWLDVTRHALPMRNLRRPMKIVVVADLQTDEITDFERNVLKTVMAEKPDLILFPGDYIQVEDPAHRAELYRQLNALFREVNLSAPLGVFAVRGNTEPDDTWREAFRGLPVTVMEQTERIVRDDFVLTGLFWRESFNPALPINREIGFHIVMGHCPNFALGQASGDLFVAGHTHGGQVRLPFIGPIITQSLVPRSWAAGVTRLDDGRTLAVSRGIGMVREMAPEIRFLCRPELMVLELSPTATGIEGATR